MNQWHNANADDEPCAVCFAGAVMTFSLNADVNVTQNPASFEDDIVAKLCALNNFREGYVA